MKSVTFEIKTNFGLSEKEIMEEILLAETRMNAGSKIRFHIRACPSKHEELEEKIKAYKKICHLASVPKFIIDHPQVVIPAQLTKEDLRWAKQRIDEYESLK